MSTAQRVYNLFLQTRAVDPVKQPSKPTCQCLNEQEELYIVGVVMSKASLYLHEVCQEICDLFQKSVSESTVCRLLKRYGISRKKICQVALQKSDSLRGAFMGHCFLFRRDMFVWAGSDN